MGGLAGLSLKKPVEIAMDLIIIKCLLLNTLRMELMAHGGS